MSVSSGTLLFRSWCSSWGLLVAFCALGVLQASKMYPKTPYCFAKMIQNSSPKAIEKVHKENKQNLQHKIIEHSVYQKRNLEPPGAVKWIEYTHTLAHIRPNRYPAQRLHYYAGHVTTLAT